jgi:hypothetical protein
MSHAARSSAALLTLSDDVPKMVHGTLLKAELWRCGGGGRINLTMREVGKEPNPQSPPRSAAKYSRERIS